MKHLFTISLVIFFTGVAGLLAAGLVITEIKGVNKTTNNTSIDSIPPVAVIDNSELMASSTVSTSTDASGEITYTTVQKQVAKQQYMNADIVAAHSTKGDCWLIIDGGVYDVDQYIPFHPGGEQEIIPSCGTDATAGFNTKGQANRPHSASAYATLKKYLIARIGDPWGTISVTEAVQVPVVNNSPSATVVDTPVGSGLFKVGSSIKVSSDVKARNKPSTSGTSLAILSTGTGGKVVDGPIYADGYWWYQISFNNGIKGWSVQDFLINSAATVDIPVATPTTITTPVVVPVTTPPTTPTTPVVVPPTSSGLTTATVATHNSSGNCWLIISGKVYDVTQYIPFHPGGENQIISYCGKEATTAFDNRGGTGSHSSSARTLLGNYLVGNLVGTPVAGTQQCTAFTYSAWGTCQSNSTQSRTVSASTPSGCTGGTPVTSQSCTYVPGITPTETTAPTVAIVNPASGALVAGTITIQVTASDASGIANVQFQVDSQTIQTDSSSPYSTSFNSTSYSDGNHTIMAIATDSVGNTKSTSVSITISNAVVTPPPTSSGLTAATVATHNTSGNCWLIISGKVYDVTQYIPFHPGGQSRITNVCGSDATTLFTSSAGQGHNHSSNARSLLGSYLVGNLQTAQAATCTSFTYSAWGTCQSNSTQSRTVSASTPSGCTGGSPITSQSCTYVPPVGGGVSCTSFTYSAWGTCQSNSTQSRTVSATTPSGCIDDSSVTSQSCTYTPAANPTTHTISVSSSGALSPSTLSIAVGDSINFAGVGLGDEVKINFSPNTISSIKIDHERTSASRTFNSAGTWTFGQGGSVTVQ